MRHGTAGRFGRLETRLVLLCANLTFRAATRPQLLGVSATGRLQLEEFNMRHPHGRQGLGRNR